MTKIWKMRYTHPLDPRTNKRGPYPRRGARRMGSAGGVDRRGFGRFLPRRIAIILTSRNWYNGIPDRRKFGKRRRRRWILRKDG